jgi:hypothetical protein
MLGEVEDRVVAERARVHEHFLRVERRVRRASLRGLGPVQRLTRALLLDELGRYRRARRYPINRDFAGKQVPYFIDEAHTRCAVAHLLEVGGQADLVQKIARERNHARVRELANEAALVHWLRAAGLSLEEAALIQPSYCTLPNPGTVAAACCRFVGSSTLLEGTIVAGEAGLTPHFVIDGIYGMPADFKVGAALYQVGDLGLQVGEQALLEVNGTSFAMQDMIHLIDHYPADASMLSCVGHAAPKATLIQALGATQVVDCETTLDALGNQWTASAPTTDCDPVGATPGCNFGTYQPALAGPAISSIGILAALLAYRRRRRFSRTR